MFEFLPVTIQSGNAVLTALLQIGAHASLSVGLPSFTIADLSLNASSGVEAAVYADFAFITNVTSNAKSVTGCDVLVEEIISIAVGANAAATLAIDTHTWEPTPNTTIHFFFATVPSICISSTSPRSAVSTTTTPASSGWKTTTISTKITFTATACLETGLLICPLPSQTTSYYITDLTLVTSVPSGSTATFPATTQGSVSSTITFGASTYKLESISGSPISFAPSATGTGSSHAATTTAKKSSGVKVGPSFGIWIAFLGALVTWCI